MLSERAKTMTRKHRHTPLRPRTNKPKCPRCGSDETAREGKDLVCGNCGSMIEKDKFK